MLNVFKKICAVFLCAILLTLVGCGKTAPQNSQDYVESGSLIGNDSSPVSQGDQSESQTSNDMSSSQGAPNSNSQTSATSSQVSQGVQSNTQTSASHTTSNSSSQASVNSSEVSQSNTQTSATPPTTSQSSSETQTSTTSSNVSQDTNIELTTESPLMNTYKLLKDEKKLTIGYIGGSITLGTSAGDIQRNWVNRVSNWFAEKFPDAKIETVNAGVSDTATNFGIFRLRNDLMNKNGHDMPDLVFVEFTSNDFIYASQNEEDLKLQIESLILNIWACNPNAEIVAVSTNTSRVASRTHYQNIFEYYNLPFIDVGYPLRKAMREKGTDTEGNRYYYTTDNLHPSDKGYEVYLQEIVKVIEPQLTNLAPQNNKLEDYTKSLPAAKSENLILSPSIVPAEKLSYNGSAQLTDKPIALGQFGSGLTKTSVEFTKSSLYVNGKTTITAEFKGSALGVAVVLDKMGFEMRWKVDDGEWKEFNVNATSWAFQRYVHSQVFMMEHNLSQGKHKVVIEFSQNTDIRLGGLLVND